jgi:hypothetical protein
MIAMRCESLYDCGKRGGFMVNRELIWLSPEPGAPASSNYNPRFRARGRHVASETSLHQNFTQAPISALLIGSDRCTAEGITARGASPVLALCRKLLVAGIDPARPLHAYRGEVLCLIIRSIGAGLLAVALIDGDVQPAQLTPERIAKPDVQSLLLKVTVRPDNSFTAQYPAQFPSRVTVRLKSGQSFGHEVFEYPGFSTQPFTWEEISAKFDKLVTGDVGAQLSRDIKDAVRSLETIEVSDLTKLLRELN